MPLCGVDSVAQQSVSARRTCVRDVCAATQSEHLRGLDRIVFW